MRDKGFTLVELIVVIAIIGLLVAIITPSLLAAKELARRVVCAANLHSMGAGVANYAADNAGQLMCSQSNMGGAIMLPPHIARVNDADWDQQHDLWLWNIESIDPYIGAFGSSGPSAGGVFICPSAKPKNWRQNYSEALSLESVDDGQELIVTPYAYYARVSSWESIGPQNGAADELIDRKLDPNRVLMSDMVWLTMTNKLVYNHGADGPALPGEGVAAPAPITGVNRLYGDGSAKWRDIGLAEAELIGAGEYTRGCVNELIPGANDTFFY